MKQLLKNISPFNNRTEMPVVLFVVKKALAFWLCYIAGLMIAETAVILLHFPFGKNMLVGEVFDAKTITLITYYGYMIVAGVTVLYWKLIEKKTMYEMGVTKHLRSYFIGGAFGVLLLVIVLAFSIATGGIKYYGVFEHADILTIALFAGGFMVQGATEEFLCRGLVLHALKEKVSLWIAMAVSTVLFILPHWSALFAGEIRYGVIGVVNLILISILFSLLTVHFKSIWAACGLHSFWNTALYSIFGLNLSGNEETSASVFYMQSVGKNIWNGGGYGMEASISTTAVLAVAVLMIAWKMYQNRRENIVHPVLEKSNSK